MSSFAYSASPILVRLFCFAHSALLILLRLSWLAYSALPILLHIFCFSRILLTCSANAGMSDEIYRKGRAGDENSRGKIYEALSSFEPSSSVVIFVDFHGF